MYKIIIVIFIIIGVRVLINITRLFQTKLLRSQYFNWLQTEPSDVSLFEKETEILSLWKSAGIIGLLELRKEKFEFRNILKNNSSVLKEFPLTYCSASITFNTFTQAIGVYKKQIWKAISPIEWLILIIYLPQKILASIGITEQKVLIHILQILYWLFGIFLTLALSLYPEEMRTIIDHLVFKK